jgi:site-specific recombinase XerD
LLWYLDELEASAQLPPNVRLGQLRARLRTRRHNKTSASSRIVSLDQARKNIPLIVQYYDELPVPEQPSASRLALLRNRAIVNLLFSTAMRVEEALKLDRGMVQDGRASNALIVGKGGRERTIHIQQYAQRAIQAYLAESTDTAAAQFDSHSRRNRDRRLTQRTVQQVIKDAIKALGLDPLLSPHDFRHYKATLLLRRGMKLEVLQEYLGHADLSTTRRIYAPLLGVEIVRGELKDYDLSPSEAAALLEEL